MKFSNSISKSHQTFASVFLAFSLFGFLLPHHGNEVKRHRLEVGLITGACAGFNTVLLCESSVQVSRGGVSLPPIIRRKPAAWAHRT
jgi:hypothetical protein